MRIMVSVLSGILMVGFAGCSSPCQPIDLTKEGTYTSGPWCYNLTITAKGSRSEGTLGTLSYDQDPVPIPENTDDYYDTPLGQFVYRGMPPGSEDNPVMPWDDKGWIHVTDTIGQALPTPGSTEAQVLQARWIMSELVQALVTSGVAPEELPEDVQPQGKVEVSKDPWGTLYKVYPDMRGGEGAGMVFRWVITSAGPDQLFDTDDDLERHSNFIQADPTHSNDPGADLLEGSTDMDPEEIEG